MKIKRFNNLFSHFSIDEYCEELKNEFDRKENLIQSLREENKKLKEGIWEKEEVAFYKKRYKEMEERYYRGFPISKEEQKEIEEWKDKHEREVHKADTFEKKLALHGVSGGRYTYIFTPTALGTSGEIQCSCGQTFEFQEIG